MSSGVDMIAEERRRQMAEEGHDESHDDGHSDGQLARAACCYASPVPLYEHTEWKRGHTFRDPWPWDLHDDKRGKHTRLEELAKAGALIAAEIDRLLRWQTETGRPGPGKRRLRVILTTTLEEEGFYEARDKMRDPEGLARARGEFERTMAEGLQCKDEMRRVWTPDDDASARALLEERRVVLGGDVTLPEAVETVMHLMRSHGMAIGRSEAHGLVSSLVEESGGKEAASVVRDLQRKLSGSDETEVKDEQ